MKIIIPTITALALITVSCNKQETNTTSVPSSESAAKPYSLDTCIVSGEKLGSMGEPIVINHEGQEIKFCCDSCVPKFNEEPAKYLSNIE